MKPYFLSFIALALLVCTPASAQTGKYEIKWTRVLMDSTFDAAPSTKVSKIMQEYRPLMEQRMMSVVGHASQEMRAYMPESPLSSFTTDALMTMGQQYSASPVDFSLINFGGLRASFPKGDVKLYDVYAVFPFENVMVILDLEGKDVLELFETFVRRGKIEALGNVKLTVKDKKIQELLIAGKLFDVSKKYRIVTIDFLLSGGDGVAALKHAVKVEDTGMMIRDMVLQYIALLKSQGKDIRAMAGNRVIIL